MKSVANTLSIVELIAKHQPCSLAELSNFSGLPKTTVQRSISTLKNSGWIHPHSTTSKPKWLLSSHLISLLTLNDEIENLREIAKPHLEKLRDFSNESVFLSKFENTGMVVIDYLESNQAVKTTAALGISAPLHATSTGKSCLSLLSDEALVKLFKQKLTRYTEKTVVDDKKLCNEFKKIKNCGYSISKGEWIDDICNIGSAIVNSQKKPIAGVGITIPTFRFHSINKEKTGEAVRDACREISEFLAIR
jgi:IclR family acetate operon transcriptional repressor